ncbi:hypothetical protein BJ165DRAFT_1488557 [Panaeolus papilionaceus]|nr:hypothetical protein BJ165DRAFT_1488557 [Panaeolus papilionaceus]
MIMSNTDLELASAGEPISSHQPVFPIELFGHIIDVLCERLDGAPLNDDQLITVKSCSLVCSSFVAISRKHIFQRIGLHLLMETPQRLENLAQLLEEASPDMKTCFRHLNINMGGYNYICSIPSMKLLVSRILIALLPLPCIESIAILFSIPPVKEHRPSTQGGDVTDLCHRLVETSISRGTLRTLYVKKMVELSILPGTSGLTSLHTLYLDRGDFNLTQHITSIKNLTIRKNRVPLTFISHFPALQTLQILRCQFYETNTPAPMAPPNGLMHLNLELCSTSGDTVPDYTSSLSMFLDFFHAESGKRGVEAFGKLRTLEVTFSQGPDFSVLDSLLRDAKKLESVSFRVLPMANISLSRMFDGIRSTRPSLSLRLNGHLGYFSDIREGVPPSSHLQSVGILSTFSRKIPLHFDSIQASDAVQPHMTPGWRAWDKFLTYLSASNSKFIDLGEMELCIFIDGEGKEVEKSDGTRVPAWTKVVDELGQREAGLLGTYLENISGTTRSRVKLMIAVYAG